MEEFFFMVRMEWKYDEGKWGGKFLITVNFKNLEEIKYFWLVFVEINA